MWSVNVQLQKLKCLLRQEVVHLKVVMVEECTIMVGIEEGIMEVDMEEAMEEDMEVRTEVEMEVVMDMMIRIGGLVVDTVEREVMAVMVVREDMVELMEVAMKQIVEMIMGVNTLHMEAGKVEMPIRDMDGNTTIIQIIRGMKMSVMGLMKTEGIHLELIRTVSKKTGEGMKEEGIIAEDTIMQDEGHLGNTIAVSMRAVGMMTVAINLTV